jgi:hypothetical protein
MAFTAQDLESVDRAIASGELSVRATDGRMLTYRSMSELLQARAVIAAALQQAASSCPRAYPRHQLADFSD